MADLTAELLPYLRQHRLPGLDLGEDFIHPCYNGFSILNLPDSLCVLLGASALQGSPLDRRLIGPLGQSNENLLPAAGESEDGTPLFREVQRVILILVDALALHRLQRWMSDGTAPIWERLAAQGRLAPLTSVVPSTTSTALTSLWTAHSAARHAITGYEMWLKEYGVVANTIFHTPISFQNDIGGLARAGFNPETFLGLPSLGSYLAAHGIQTYVFQQQNIAHSGLSQMLLKGARIQSFLTASDLWVSLRRLLESKPAERLLAYVYWGEIDSLSHRYGPDDEPTAAEFASFSASLNQLLLERLSPTSRQHTLLILTGDHGQIHTSPDAGYELNNHLYLTRRLHLYPTGENRLAYLYIRPGYAEDVQEYIERTWPNQFSLINTAYAIEQGLFGPGVPNSRLHERTGDAILLARGNAYLWWSNKENLLLGRHGGLSPEEMLVPFLAARL